MKIEKFEKKHLIDAKKLSDTLFDDGWTLQQFEQELFKQNSIAFVLIDNLQLIGFIFAQTVADQAEILDVGIQKQMQGNGFGKLLVQTVVDFCKQEGKEKIFLEVRKDNICAIKLYTSFGFETNRVRAKYYGNQDGLEMVLNLQ